MKVKNNKFRRLTILLSIAGLLLLWAGSIAATLELSWQPNTEPDLAGYKIYYGTSGSGVYSIIIDVGNVNTYDLTGLSIGATYYLVVTAYDENGNESGYSEEVSYQIKDVDPPVITSASCVMVDKVVVTFNEQVEKISAELESNYSINNGVTVQTAELQSDNKTVYLYTTSHSNGNYILTINNVRDRASVPNAIAADTHAQYSWTGNDETPPRIADLELKNDDFIVIEFSEPVEQSSATDVSHYSISPAVQINSVDIAGTFRKVYITTAEHTRGQNYTMTVNGVKDGAGNVMNSVHENYSCISEDTDPPVLTAARINKDGDEIVLEFSETLDQASAETKSNYSISPSVSITSVSLNSDQKSVTLQTAVHSAGEFEITASNVGDNANPPNYISSGVLSYTYTPPDHTPPAIVSVEIPNSNLLQVTFSEPLEGASAENVSNYSISPHIKINNATLDVSGEKVLLETEEHQAGSYSLTVNNIRDRAEQPNTIASGSSKSYEYNPPDTDPPYVTEIDLHGEDVLEIVFNESLDRTASETVTNYQISPSVEIKSAVLVGDTLNRVYLSTGKHIPGGTYTISISGIKDRAPAPNIIASGTTAEYTCPVIDNTSPRLVTAVLQGNNFLKLVFSEAVDQTSAENKLNYSIAPSLNIEEATLDASLKIVFLKTARHQPGTDYTVTVTGVKDRANPANVIGTENSVNYRCESVDNIPPELLRADLHGNVLLELSFSEPLDKVSALNSGNYSIDNGISIEQVSMSESQMQVFLKTSQHQKGTYTVKVNNLRDLAEIPNTIEPNSSFEYTYTPVDTISPVVASVSTINKNTIEIVFDEALDRNSAETTDNYSINNGVVVQKAILNSSLSIVYLQTTEFNPGNYVLTVKNITDASENANKIQNTSIQYVYHVLDEVSPTLASTEAKSSKMVLVTFSEPMEAVSAEKITNYTINPGIQVTGAYLTSSDKQVVLETSEHAAGEYTLTVNGVRDASSSHNPIAQYSTINYTWSPADTVKPKLVSYNLPTDSYLELFFSEPVNDDQANNKVNYTIDPPVQIINASLSSNLDVVGLVTSKHAPGTYTVTVNNITDRAFNPNVIGGHNKLTYTYIPPDTVGPKLIALKVNSPQSMALIFDEELDRETAENIANYSIDKGIQISDVSLLASLTTVHIETSPHQPSETYTITISGLKDRAPSPNAIRSPIKKAYSYDPPDTEKPELVSAKLISGANLVELVFSEKIDKKTAENRENYIIDPSVEVNLATLDTVTLKKVRLETTDHRPGIQYSVSARNIKDLAPVPNVIDASKWVHYQMPGSGSMADNTPPQISRVDVVSRNKIDIVFSEPVNKATAENVKNYVISDTIKVVEAKLDTDKVKAVLTTSNHIYGKSYTISVKSIKDASQYQNAMSSETDVKYLITKEAALSNVNRPAYQFAILHLSDKSYVDRSYTIEQIPAYLDSIPRVVTANDDKMSDGSSFLSFELWGEATVYVAFDRHIESLPSWLSNWKQTGDQLVDSRDNVFMLFSREFSSGRVVLGGNKGTMDDNMYMVYIEPRTDSKAVIASLSKTSYDVEHISVGDTCYIDRPHTITSIPSQLEELLWIRTANDDKLSTDPLSFHLNKASVVYVAHDKRITELPDWLSGWDELNEQISNSRSDKYNIFYKKFSEGDVELGANGGTAEDNMYFVLIKPVDEKDNSGAGPKIPKKFELLQNYPNPFNPSTHIRTNIRFKINDNRDVNLVIYNILGQAVKEFNLSQDQLRTGVVHEVVWDGRDNNGAIVASGVYFCRLKVGAFALTRRMLLLR
ncbi:Ig-like domain-containing protein [bacterium]|nr:Ig-like domain-containing protein [bacterium]